MTEQFETDESTRERDPWNDGPWNEIASLVLFAIGIVVLLALASYSSQDRSFNTLGVDEKTRNWIGVFGAYLADLLYQTCGVTAFSLPVVLFLGGWWQWDENRSPLTKGRIVGMLLMFLALTGIFTFLLWNQEPRNFYPGGTIGHWLVDGPVIGLSLFLGKVGAVFAIVLLFMIGLVMSTSISIIGSVVQFTPLEQRLDRAKSDTLWRRRERQSSQPQITGSVESISVETSPAPPMKRGARTETPASLASQPVEARQEKSGRASKSPRVAVTPVPPPASTATPGITPAPSAKAGDEVPYRRVDISSPTIPDKSSPPASSDEAVPQARPGVTRKRATPKPVSFDDGDAPTAELDADTGQQSRTVAEMMATASVVRPETGEEPESYRPIKTAKAASAKVSSDYKLPSTEMLSPPAPRSEMAETELLERARHLAEKCNEFNVSGQVQQISPGPVVTTFEFKPDPGVKYSRVTSLVDDLCLALKAESIRIDRIAGKSTVGIEVPNSNREMIRLREVIESRKFRETTSKLTFAIGKTIDGSNYAADLAKMPHLLIAGATGAGKSVMLNAILVSLLYKATPDEVKMILVDPKRLELGLYADIPHLLTPIVTDPKRASYALKWAVSEMENRYKHLATFGVRNIDQYNKDVCNQGSSQRSRAKDDNEAPQPLPYIVVVIDELADLMMVSARDVEESITRLAQMARAVGIHLVLATQRPSVDVITGLIKANFPSRISFRVSSKVDSRTIIDTNGAEQLLGQGDMLFLPPGTSRLVRVHGAYVDEKEVHRIAEFVRSQANPTYDDKVVMSEKEADGGSESDMARDEKYDDALRVVLQSGKASTSLLQRNLRIGYGRAASIIDMMHREGIVGPEDGSKPRQVLVKADFLERLDQLREEKRL